MLRANKSLFIKELPLGLKYLSSFAVGKYYDVVVCGGGLVGGAMTAALASSSLLSNKKILLLDKMPEPEVINETPISYSNRVIAVSPGSKKLLEKLGAWKFIPRACKVKKMQVWETCSDSLITFDKENMTETLAYIVENNLVINGLFKSLTEIRNPNVSLKFQSHISNIIYPKETVREQNKALPLVEIHLQNDKVIRTQLLLAADGAQSFVAQQTNFDKFNITYDQTAIVATLDLTEATADSVAWQRFLTTGPLAMLPLNESQSSLIWSTTTAEAKRLMELTNEEFCDEINKEFVREGPKDIFNPLKGIEQAFLAKPNFQLPPTIKAINGKRACFPLGISHANHYVKPRVVLLGDAAHRVHPLAGQGANLGFGDVSCLLKTLEKAVYEGRDVGTLHHLLDYESKRQRHNISVMGTCHLLLSLYSTEISPVVSLRSLGLSLVNNNPFIKDFFMSRAMS